MEEYQKELIREVFKRCFGLKENCKYFDSENKAFKTTAFQTLSEKTGIRVDFLEKHKEEILLI